MSAPAAQSTISIEQCRELLRSIPDPEIPVVTIEDLGIFRGVVAREDGTLLVHITPTYSGCPAMHAIQEQVEQTLRDAGVLRFEVNLQLSPAWTTDWISETGRAKLKAFGIAPPQHCSKTTSVRAIQTLSVSQHAGSQKDTLSQPLFNERRVACPRCDSTNTQLVSAFGSTPCQEQWRCLDCCEPFDSFKCH